MAIAANFLGQSQESVSFVAERPIACGLLERRLVERSNGEKDDGDKFVREVVKRWLDEVRTYGFTFA